MEVEHSIVLTVTIVVDAQSRPHGGDEYACALWGDWRNCSARFVSIYPSGVVVPYGTLPDGLRR